MLKPCKFPVTFIKATNTPRGHVSIISKSDTQRSFLGSSHFMGVQAGWKSVSFQTLALFHVALAVFVVAPFACCQGLFPQGALAEVHVQL